MQDYISIETLDGEIIEGFKVSHPSELPRNARLHKYSYSTDMQTMYGIYRAIGTKTTKIFIHKTK